MNNCVCNLEENEYKLLRSTGGNNLCIEFINGEYKIFSMKDNRTNIVEFKINYCPLCGKKLENKEVVKVKYNINNLDNFINDKDRINNKIFKPSEQLVNKILDNRLNMIEDKIKDLLSPYIDIELIKNKQSYEMRDILKEKGYILLCNRDNFDYEEYCICDNKTGMKDYFIVKNNVDLEKGESQLYISDIIRGIE